MSIEVSPELEQFVNQEVASGHFADKNSVIEHALRLLQRDRNEAIMGIKAGLADVDAGHIQPVTETFAELRSEFGISKDV